MRTLLFVATIIVIAAVAMASHDCTHDPPGNGCVNHPRWPGDGSSESCAGGGSGPPATPLPVWEPQPYGNHVPHVTSANVIPVMLTYNVYQWDADWAEHYFNAVGFWNVNLGNSILHDVTVIEDARVWVVRPGSADEVLVNAFVNVTLGYSFYDGNSCHTSNPGIAWATVNFARENNVAGHSHHEYQKICLWGSSTPTAPKNTNTSGDHRWWLTLTHEFGHVLSLPHEQPGQCVMKSGLSMIAPCPAEVTWVDQHYGL